MLNKADKEKIIQQVISAGRKKGPITLGGVALVISNKGGHVLLTAKDTEPTVSFVSTHKIKKRAV